MTTLILLLFLSPLFGGDMEVTIRFREAASCERLKAVLTKFTVKHEIKQDCH